MPRDWQRGDDEGSFDDRFKKEKKHKNDNYNRRQLGIGEIHGTQERQEMTRESQDPGEESEIRIEQYEQYLLLCMRCPTAKAQSTFETR